MNKDTIYRQDALDALGERPLVWTNSDYAIAQRNQYDTDKLAIETVPSAQPEVTEEAVKDYCRKRCLTILTNDYFHKLTSAQPEIIRCKDCKHRIVNEHAGEKGYLNLKAMCELDSGDPFELGRCAEDDEWFCADAEKRTE
jgi:hypothetical protein